MKKLIPFVILFIISAIAIAQENSVVVENPLTSKSYNLKVMEDLNLIITGDKNIKQGLSYAYSKANEKITLSGPLGNIKNSGLLTIDGKFESNEGSVIFNNNEKGAKRFGLTLNYFVTIGKGNFSKYGFINNSSFESNRSLLALDYNRRYTNSKEKLIDSLATYLIFAKIFNISMSKNEIPVIDRTPEAKEEEEEEEGTQKGSIFTKKMIGGLLKKYYAVKPGLQKKTVSKLLEMGKCSPDDLGKYRVHIFKNNNDEKVILGYVYKGFKLQQFLKDLQKLIDRYKNYDQILYKSEKKMADNLWTAHSLIFFGIHGSYKRESVDVFTFKDSIYSFNNDLFNTKRGDIFEVGLSANIFNTFKQKKWFFFGKVLLTFSNATNFTEFNKNTYKFSVPVNESLAGTNIVIRESSKTGYVNKNGRDYSDKGNAFGSGLELYGGSKKIGLFTKIEFKINHEYSKIIPWRAGVYFNFASKEKELVSILLFTERTNMILHPGKDFNIGFKIGLPLKLNKAL